MLTMLIYDRNPEELELIKKLVKDIFAYFSEDKLELYCYAKKGMVTGFLEKAPLMDMACIRIMGKDEIMLLRYMRKMYAQSDFMLIADAALSPMEYLTPDIRAASLLLHPYGAEQLRQVFRMFLRSFLEKRTCVEGKDFFILENQGSRTAIPFHQIYYIEVREKKVFVRLWNKEYSKYDSLEHILEKLPDTFLRCHRSFVFNTQHLVTVRLSENTIYLEHGIMIPLSRSYKSVVKEYIYGLHGE